MRRLSRSFGYAFAGMASAIQTETNWKIGIAESLLVVAVAWYLHISRSDWLVVIIMIGLVLSAELFNSAIEKVIDTLTPSQHPQAKLAKDFAAAAVVVLVIVAALVGSVIFIPYLSK